ncbi:hypothetical protein SAMN05661091_0196 [Paenibacillus uliginis N3/975]|uniref:Uncharacterized protein n=1 Tax=Paenibacillus uliginis N3/975 TaxID=1313296 RepID=A0A1X7G8I0_9BACL|nr:hypothetical protein SAMN05661091_0196 [Paenibacillus uliginis N3/975]
MFNTYNSCCAYESFLQSLLPPNFPELFLKGEKFRGKRMLSMRAFLWKAFSERSRCFEADLKILIRLKFKISA